MQEHVCVLSRCPQPDLKKKYFITFISQIFIKKGQIEEKKSFVGHAGSAPHTRHIFLISAFGRLDDARQSTCQSPVHVPDID
jgi:hypothetical protein